MVTGEMNMMAKGIKELAKGITSDPNVMAGKPVIQGTLITVDSIMSKLSATRSIDDILSDYPELTVEQIKDCLRYAAILVQRKKRRRSIIPW
jgi:uncharacterized protein (DUF433 family)